MKQNAFLLHGDDIRDLIQEVTLDNLDFRNTHEILFKRLWAMLLYIPKSFIFRTPNAPARRAAGYISCRNALDLDHGISFLKKDCCYPPTASASTP